MTIKHHVHGEFDTDEALIAAVYARAGAGADGLRAVYELGREDGYESGRNDALSEE